jgi:hypothetical protein
MLVNDQRCEAAPRIPGEIDETTKYFEESIRTSNSKSPSAVLGA